MELKKKTIKDTTITIRLDTETLKKLNELAEKSQITNAEVIRQLIDRFSKRK